MYLCFSLFWLNVTYYILDGLQKPIGEHVLKCIVDCYVQLIRHLEKFSTFYQIVQSPSTKMNLVGYKCINFITVHVFESKSQDWI